jgi:hypothetical protein
MITGMFAGMLTVGVMLVFTNRHPTVASGYARLIGFILAFPAAGALIGVALS